MEDTRKHSSGRPLERELSIEQKYARLEAKIRLMEAKNELLKKDRYTRKAAVEKEIKLVPELKFELIHETIEKYNLNDHLL